MAASLTTITYLNTTSFVVSIRSYSLIIHTFDKDKKTKKDTFL